MTLKILLAGKEITHFQEIKDSFENEDVIVITANSIALALFLARKNQPGLIISQEELIDGAGQTFYAEIKNEAELTNIPFIWLNQKNFSIQEIANLKEIILDIAKKQ